MLVPTVLEGATMRQNFSVMLRRQWAQLCANRWRNPAPKEGATMRQRGRNYAPEVGAMLAQTWIDHLQTGDGPKLGINTREFLQKFSPLHEGSKRLCL